jgi:hypothetical protein
MTGHEPDFGESTAPADASEAAAPEPESAPALSAAAQRFQSCRWRKVADSGVPEHCTHRDVQPMAGTAGFSPEAWCLECGHYKIRRNPRKRPLPSPDDRYYY